MSDRFISPDALQRAACEAFGLTDGPQSHIDWQKCANYWAFNISAGSELAVCRIMAMIYSAPLTDDELAQIVTFQRSKRQKESRS